MPPTAPNNYDTYYDFVYALANRYKSRVKYFQIENEVYNAKMFWYGTKDEYLLLLKTAFTAIKSADKSLSVLPASLALADVDVTQGIPSQYENTYHFVLDVFKSSTNFFDIADIHLYYSVSSISDRLPWFKTLMGYNKKPVWVTETGGLDSRAYPDYDDSSMQSIDLVKRYVTAFGDSVQKMFYLQINKTKPLEASPWTGIAITNDSMAIIKRPAYYTFKLLISKIGQFSSVSKITYGYKFIVNERTILVLWNPSLIYIDATQYIQNPQSKITHIITAQGQLIPSTNIYKTNYITIDSIPVFIEKY